MAKVDGGYVGTGKTLSIICSALQWLVDRKQGKQDFKKVSNDVIQDGKPEDQSTSDDEPDWMRNFVLNKESEPPQDNTKKKTREGFRSMKRGNKKEKEEGSATIRDMVSSNGDGGGGREDVDRGEVKILKKKIGVVELDDEEFLLEDYESEGEDGVQPKKRGCGGISVESSSGEEDVEDGLKNEEEGARLKIYFCSRTHSQLSQFIKELRKTRFASELKVAILGSRKIFCINEGTLINYM